MRRLAALGCAAVLLAGCASEGDHQHPFPQGWRYAVVLRLEGFETPRRPGDDCRLAGSPARYAEVEFHDQRVLRHRIARLPAEALDVRVGGQVYVNVGDCALPVAQRP